MSKLDQYGCKMTITQHGKMFSWETSTWDCDMDDFLEAFYGMMIGLTYHPETVLRGMKEFADERLGYLGPIEDWDDEDDREDEDDVVKVEDDDPARPIDVRPTAF